MRRIVLFSSLMLAVPLLAPAGGAAPAALVDPRSGGLEVAMGEWTVVPEARAIRPGEVTFVVRNRGRFRHGFRIRSLESGRDRFEARTRVLGRGETARLTVTLPAGVYDAECFVEDAHGDHEARGMHARLEVRDDAPLVESTRPSGSRVEIRGFAFRPAPLVVKRGTMVKWTNQDAAKHTVSATNGAFSSRELVKGGTYARKFGRVGRFRYLCAIHPAMKGTVVVRR